MKRKFLLVNSTTTSGTVTEQRIGNKDYYIISGAGSIVSNSVMNGIYYPLEEVKKLAASNVGRIPAPVSHPRSEDDNYISATDQVAQNDYGIGAFSFNYRMDGDRLVRDIAVPKDAGLNADKHAVLVERIQNHEDVDTSTGVIFEPLVTNGVGSDGEEYSMVAKNMMLDHDALLPFEVGASTTLMGTGLFANAAGDTSEVYEYNASMPAMNLPLAPEDTKWEALAADKLIREYTNSTDEPSSTYRRYFLYFDRSDVKNYGSYKLPFATIINGKPYAVLNAINNAMARLSQTKGLSESDKSSAQKVIDHYKAKAEKMTESQTNSDKNVFAKAWNAIKSKFSANQLSFDEIYSKIRIKLNGSADKYDKWPCDIYQSYFIYRDDSSSYEIFYRQEYHITSADEIEFDGTPEKVKRSIEYTTVTNGENAMREKILAALNAAGVKTEGLSDDALFAAYNEQMKKAQPGADGAQGDDEDMTPEEKAAAKKKKAAGNSDEAPEWAKTLLGKVNKLETAINSDKEAALNAKAKQVAALNMGISEEVAKTMGVKGCDEFLAKNSGFVNAAWSSNSAQSDSDPFANMEAPE